MVHAAKADDAVARALVARHSLVIEAVRAEDRAAGKIEGKMAADGYGARTTGSEIMTTISECNRR